MATLVEGFAVPETKAAPYEDTQEDYNDYEYEQDYYEEEEEWVIFLWIDVASEKWYVENFKFISLKTWKILIFSGFVE